MTSGNRTRVKVGSTIPEPPTDLHTLMKYSCDRRVHFDHNRRELLLDLRGAEGEIPECSERWRCDRCASHSGSRGCFRGCVGVFPRPAAAVRCAHAQASMVKRKCTRNLPARHVLVGSSLKEGLIVITAASSTSAAASTSAVASSASSTSSARSINNIKTCINNITTTEGLENNIRDREIHRNGDR